jgi:SAM-dependent methyltransferase
MIKWIDTQTKFNFYQWNKAIDEYYPEYSNMWKDPKEHFRCLNELWNTLDAAKLIDWQKYIINDNSVVLDIGGGTGWLSAYLSNIENLSKLYVLDSSEFFLEHMLPEVVELMHGNIDKIVPVEGFFTPILFEDKSIDLVVASSSLHHGENLEFLLNEISRVLKNDGILIILNETPCQYLKYLTLVLRCIVKILARTISSMYKSSSPSISSSGYLYNPTLGDRIYPEWYWRKALSAAHFHVKKVIRTGYFSTKKDKSGIRLTHFICGK